MGGRSSHGFADRVIAAIAARQFGVVSRRQLMEAGVTRRQIERRLEAGRLHALHLGVYLVGHQVPAPCAREMAALLACGEGAAVAINAGRIRLTHSRPSVVLSHRSAAAFWNLIPYPAPGDVCLTVPPGRNNDRSQIKVHRANLAPRDIRRRRGMPLTSHLARSST